MPATTPHGYPYPVGTDRLMDGDNAIQALAEAVDSKLGVAAAGSVAYPAGGAGITSVTVTFPAGRFTVAPVVVVTSTHPGVIAATPTPTATAATIYGQGKDAAGNDINMPSNRAAWWHALQTTATAATTTAAPPPDAVVTCRTPGCDNAGIDIPVSLVSVDADGIEHTSDAVTCGVCGQPITDARATE